MRSSISPVLRALLLAAACLQAGTTAAAWRAVPGAEGLQLDVSSMQVDRRHVAVWLRWWGRPALMPEPAAHLLRGARVHRTALLTRFDCGARTLRVLAANAYDARGTAVLMSSVPGPVLPVGEGELAWAYDAACEAARSGPRL